MNTQQDHIAPPAANGAHPKGTSFRAPPAPGQVVRGAGVSPGIAIGPAYVYARDTMDVQERRIAAGQVGDEVARFEEAVARAERDLAKIIAVTHEKLGDESAGVFEAQQLMLRDEAVYEAVVEHIRLHRCNADYAVEHVMRQHRQRLEASDNAYMRERAHDLVDVQERIVRHLRREKLISCITPGTIVVAESLTAADLILFSRRGILGCVTEQGAATSHLAIMARALGLPAVVGVPEIADRVADDDPVVMDGWEGYVSVRPTEQQVALFTERKERYGRWRDERKRLAGLPAETTDGRRIALRANLELPQEIDLLDEYGAEGVGLFRTEMLMLQRGRALHSEEFNARIYREVVQAVAPEVTTLRLLDLGGDKLLPMAHREHNPFLGWRGIRILLDRLEVLRAQVRAVLRASAHGPLRLLLPMVSQVEEVRRFREVLAVVQEELSEDEVDFDPHIPVGIMVEVPAVALQLEHFVEEVDFFSIGTNDLTQFMMAVDRGNNLVASRFSEFHPSILRLIRQIVEVGEEHGLPVSLCGEMAARLQAVPLLVGLGVPELSASPTYLPDIKRVIRSIGFDEARALAEEALAQHSAEAVRALADDWLHAHVAEVVQPLALEVSSSELRVQGSTTPNSERSTSNS